MDTRNRRLIQPVKPTNPKPSPPMLPVALLQKQATATSNYLRCPHTHHQYIQLHHQQHYLNHGKRSAHLIDLQMKYLELYALPQLNIKHHTFLLGTVSYCNILYCVLRLLYISCTFSIIKERGMSQSDQSKFVPIVFLPKLQVACYYYICTHST